MSTHADQRYNVRVRLGEAELERLKELAKLNERSVAAEIRLAVRRHIELEASK